jgi:hypothetical protein
MAADSPDSAVITSDLETELSRALGELGIGKVDHDTTAILTHAALLRPARGEEVEGISTSRLFVGIVAVGELTAYPDSYPRAVAAAISGDPEFTKAFDTIRSFFELDGRENAVLRLRDRWFSANVREILI